VDRPVVADGRLEKRFNRSFFTRGDSREPSRRRLGAVSGSILTLFVTLLLAFPIGVAAAIYSRSSPRRTASPT